jgi:hypothetical protein
MVIGGGATFQKLRKQLLLDVKVGKGFVVYAANPFFC